MASGFTRHPSSYRDPSGFLFTHEGVLYRQVNKVFKEDFDLFISSGLYDTLVAKELVISHKEMNNIAVSEEHYKTLQPDFIPFISYPYEWPFDMWKDAALNTLDVAKEAMACGMMLKDASAYNVQLHHGRMMFIDTLSFEKYDDSKPWIAYRQFCEHFLAPLALMHYLKEPLQKLFVAYPDGIPVTLAKKLLPFRSKLNLHNFLHLHLNSSKAETNTGTATLEKSFSKQKLSNILDSLRSAISSYSFEAPTGVWSEYYKEAGEREDYLSKKKEIIDSWVQKLNISSAIDVGANEGEFSELLAKRNIFTISADFDHYSINKLYNRIKAAGVRNIHPLIVDLSHPSPAIGVNNTERTSFLDRVQTQLVMALALIHHLAIGKNIPFENIAGMFRKLGKQLIVEYVPKEDTKIQLMLQQKKDVYHWYTQENFLNAFSAEYKIVESAEVGTSKRILYLMESHEA